MLVIATKDFTVGPAREVVIRKGTIRQVELDEAGHFMTVTNQPYTTFGWCRLGDGWEKVPHV